MLEHTVEITGTGQSPGGHYALSLTRGITDSSELELLDQVQDDINAEGFIGPDDRDVFVGEGDVQIEHDGVQSDAPFRVSIDNGAVEFTLSQGESRFIEEPIGAGEGIVFEGCNLVSPVSITADDDFNIVADVFVDNTSSEDRQATIDVLISSSAGIDVSLGASNITISTLQSQVQMSRSMGPPNQESILPNTGSVTVKINVNGEVSECGQFTIEEVPEEETQMQFVACQLQQP